MKYPVLIVCAAYLFFVMSEWLVDPVSALSSTTLTPASSSSQFQSSSFSSIASSTPTTIRASAVSTTKSAASCTMTGFSTMAMAVATLVYVAATRWYRWFHQRLAYTQSKAVHRIIFLKHSKQCLMLSSCYLWAIGLLKSFLSLISTVTHATANITAMQCVQWQVQANLWLYDLLVG